MNPKLSLAIGIICIAFSPIFVKLIPLSALSAAFYRLLFAWVFLAPYFAFKGSLHIDTKSLIIAIIGGLIFGSDIAVWNIAILKSTATISTVVANLAPVWVGILSIAIYKERPGTNFWIGTLVAIAGMVILVGTENVLHLQLTEGVLYAVFSSVLYAAYILVSKKVLARIDTLAFMFYNMLAATVFLGVLCVTDHDAIWGFSANTWLYLGALGLICQLLGWITINYAISHMYPTHVAIALLGQAVVTALLAWIILNEHVGFIEIIGGIVVLAGIGLTFAKKKSATVE